MEIGDLAHEYMRNSLRDGLSLARISMAHLEETQAVVLVPEGTHFERVLEFGRGGIGFVDTAELALLLQRMFPGYVLTLELPLWQPADPGVRDEAGVVICGSEVYAVRSLDDSSDDIEETLRLIDTAFMYHAFVLQSDARCDENYSPLELVDSGSAVLKAMLVGAYDGEGFVLSNSAGVGAPVR